MVTCAARDAILSGLVELREDGIAHSTGRKGGFQIGQLRHLHPRRGGHAPGQAIAADILGHTGFVLVV